MCYAICQTGSKLVFCCGFWPENGKYGQDNPYLYAVSKVLNLTPLSFFFFFYLTVYVFSGIW